MLAAIAIVLAAPVFEAELAGGFAHTLEPDAETAYPAATPAIQGRVAIDLLDTFALGATALAIVGGQAPRGAGPSPDSGHQAFSAVAAFATARLHSRGGPLQVWGEAGLGPGHLISLQTNSSFEHPPLRGHGGLSARLALGLRYFVSQRVPVGAEFSLTRWSNVEQGLGSGVPGIGPAQNGLSSWAWLLMLSVGISLGR